MKNYTETEGKRKLSKNANKMGNSKCKLAKNSKVIVK